jgi:hypothetical protein
LWYEALLIKNIKHGQMCCIRERRRSLSPNVVDLDFLQNAKDVICPTLQKYVVYIFSFERIVFFFFCLSLNGNLLKIKLIIVRFRVRIWVMTSGLTISVYFVSWVRTYETKNSFILFIELKFHIKLCKLISYIIGLLISYGC